MNLLKLFLERRGLDWSSYLEMSDSKHDDLETILKL